MLNAIRKIHEAPKIYQQDKTDPLGLSKVDRQNMSVADDTVKSVFNAIKESVGISQSKLMKRCDKSKETIRRALIRLLNDEKISRVETGKNGKNYIYSYFEFGKEFKPKTTNEKFADEILKLLSNKGTLTNKQLRALLNTTIYRVGIVTKQLEAMNKITTQTRVGEHGNNEFAHTINNQEESCISQHH